MRRDSVQLNVPGTDLSPTVIAYGHWGRPVLVFPSEGGSAWDYENNGMVGAVADLIDAGRVKLYCVDSLDAFTWSDRSIPLEERARRHATYAAWIRDVVAPWIHADCGGPVEIAVTGCSMGAYHALQAGLTRADLFPVVIGLSGNYDVATWHAWGERGDATYFANPADYVPNLHGEHLDWLRGRLSVVLVCGQGAWETHPTGSLPATRAMGASLQDKGIRCEVDLWGFDVSHDWEWWQRQIAHHLPRFC
jgi:esterase/lipase superfamily enzyme